jgi:hypothetical protein
MSLEMKCLSPIQLKRLKNRQLLVRFCLRPSASPMRPRPRFWKHRWLRSATPSLPCPVLLRSATKAFSPQIRKRRALIPVIPRNPMARSPPWTSNLGRGRELSSAVATTAMSVVATATTSAVATAATSTLWPPPHPWTRSLSGPPPPPWTRAQSGPTPRASEAAGGNRGMASARLPLPFSPSPNFLDPSTPPSIFPLP